MITKVYGKIRKLKQWHRVYFLLPRTISVNGVSYRIFRDYCWRRADWYDSFEDIVWGWEYSLEKPN